MLRMIPFTRAKIQDPVWLKRLALVRDTVLPYQWEILNDRVPGAESSHCIRNFKAAAGQVDARHGGMVFQDSDLYKWLEAVAYSLAVHPDSALMALADEAVNLIAAAQEEDGYLNTYYTLEKPDRRYTNLMEGHELYCAGHFIEAAVAYHQATGRDKVLDVAMKLARHLHRVFMNHKGYPGHPEVELALIRLYEHTGEDFLFDLALRFINNRGTGENQLDLERKDPAHEWIWEDMKRFDDQYFQAHAPVREQKTAEGHSVRAMYLFAAMADAARHSGEQALKTACVHLMDNVKNRRIYVTGGIGSASFGERFTTDYDLPNDSMYCETCASIGLMLFARRMTALTGDLHHYDLWERALSNTVLAGMGEDGRHFFYVNPLEVRPDAIHHNMTYHHVKPVRQSWFGVACCPPNIARTLPSLAGSLYAFGQDNSLYVLAHIASQFEDQGYTGTLKTTEEGCEFTLKGPATSLHLRVPEGFRLLAEQGQQEGGVHILSHPGGEASYRYRLLPVTRIIRAHPRVSSCAGKACLVRGLTVYCLEEKDNGAPLSGLYACTGCGVEEIPSGNYFGLPVLKLKGARVKEGAFEGQLYSEAPLQYQDQELVFVPYAHWGNRGEGEMQVWFNVKSCTECIEK